MKEVLKRILALTLAFVMVLGLAPAFEMKAEAADLSQTDFYANSVRLDYDPNTTNFENFNKYWDMAISMLDTYEHVTIMLCDNINAHHIKETLELENEERLTLDLNGFTIDRDSYDEDGQIFYI